MLSYEDLKNRLELNILEIDHELMSLPALVQEAAELSTMASADEHAARHALDVVTAEAASRLRAQDEGKKVRSETQIASEIALDEEVQIARKAYDDSRLDAARASALFNSMREKGRLIGKAADLIVAGFITPSSYSARRVELRGKFRSDSTPAQR